ncbi:MAG TPA: prepilin-type N-terminal cleavage/methylation domain-containing protein [Tepidisphaeraceae bacterium]|nr:prepilin-type N-terminal cleavage/methylation domain-containing protein [Tepidisphaeraceae bacterium]
MSAPPKMKGKNVWPTLKATENARPGFSLVELIIVIGIIALLLGTLMPTLSLVRERGKELQCIATLRSIGQAAAMHCNEHDQYLPCAGWQWNPIDGVVNPHGMGDDQARRYDYYTDDDELRPLPITAALARYMNVLVNTGSRQALEKDLEGEAIQRLFRCPSQQIPLSGWTQRDSEGWISPDEVSSYVFNEAILGRRDHDAITRPFPGGHITAIRDTAHVFFAMDGRTRDPVTDRCFLVFDYGPNDTLKDWDRNIQSTSTLGKELIDYWRHRRRTNVLFADWHVGTYSTDPGDLDLIGVSKGVN